LAFEFIALIIFRIACGPKFYRFYKNALGNTAETDEVPGRSDNKEEKVKYN